MRRTDHGGRNMQDAILGWPRKSREVQNCICDSTRWNGFKFRDDDIVIASYAKTGTTWTQQIVGELIFRGAAFAVLSSSPWVDFRLHPRSSLGVTSTLAEMEETWPGAS